MVQLQTFPEEMKVLTSLKGVYKDTPDRMDARKHNQAIKRRSSLYRLDPFLDSESLMRVGERIRRAKFSIEFKQK